MTKPSDDSLPRTGEGIVLDIGTGDGLFVYRCARENPGKFFIGIDANPRPLEKVSEKIHRKASKGGLPNVLFLQATIEDLPPELNGVADEIHIHFPWGSLLRAVAAGEETVLRSLRRVCAAGAMLEVVIGLDPERDRFEVERLGLPPMTAAHVNSVLVPRYEDAGFRVLEAGALPQSEWSRLHTTWGKRLKENPNRTLAYIVARAAEVEEPRPSL